MSVFPKFSIVIPTYNSQKTLGKTLDSLKKQTYPKDKIEILIIDGGSSDKTLIIAKKYHCKIYKNLKTELVYGKHIGYLKASGKYLMFIDSDEVLENINSLKLKYSALQIKNVKSVFLSGYKTPKNFLAINNYSNEFGEPFSFFIYRESKGDGYLLENWLKKYKKVFESKDFTVFDFTNEKSLPIIELWAGGCVIELKYTKKFFPEIKKNPGLLAHLFYLLNRNGSFISITKNDPTIHYSSENYKKYLKKINSRIKNNIFFTKMGEAGYIGRENFQSTNLKYKKYLFLIYGLTIIMPLLDGFNLAFKRQNLIYLLHFPLTLFTTYLIIYYYFLKILRVPLEVKTYGR